MKLSALKPNDRNPRTIKTEAFARLVASIKRDPEFMVLRPIVHNADGKILGGNMRWRACKELGLKEIPDAWAVDASTLTPEQQRRFILIDNAPEGMAGEWDYALLADEWELPELEDLGFELPDADEAGNDGKDAAPQTDRAEELRKEWGVEPGQLWALGDHRLLCGDSTKAEDVARVIGGVEKAGAIVTDPPYAFGLASTEAMAQKSGGWDDQMNNAAWFRDLLSAWRQVSPGGLWWMFCSWRTLPIVMKAANDARQAVQSVLVWHKDWIGPGGTKGLRPSYELVALFADGDAAVADRGQPDLITVPWSSHKPSGHGAEKPVDLLVHLVKLTVGSVFEPFCGSGTTIIACEQLGRKCRAIEIAPGYVAVALQRWADATSGKPELVTS